MTEQIPPILRPDRVTPVALYDFAKQFDLTIIGSQENVSLTGISMNTGDLRPGDLFVAMPGKKTHGANFVTKAIQQGAVAVVTDSAGIEILGPIELPILVLENPRAHLGELAAYVYGNVPGNMPKLLQPRALMARLPPATFWRQFFVNLERPLGLPQPPRDTSLVKSL